jgi:Leucine-rich repeat (LRR) protein
VVGQIPDLPALSSEYVPGLKNLTHLSLSATQVNDVSALQALKSLTIFR